MRITLILIFLAGVSIPAFPSIPRSHPRLLADSADVAQARRWMKESPWYRSIIEEHRGEVDRFISRRPITVSPVKQVYQYKMYTCPNHDVELLYEEFRPSSHRCPNDTTESFRGGKYDAAWSGWYNRRLADHLVWMGILYQLTGEEDYAAAGREILMGFAGLYLHYPTSNTILGPAHVFFGTLSESFWGVDMAYGYDLLFTYPGFTADDHRKLKDSLFLPLARITQQFPESASNRQLWYNNVSAAVGFLYGDQELIDFALRGTYGFEWQLGSALPESGFWAEWSGYHFVALRGMIHLAEMARHNGIDLYHVRIAGRSMKKMFDSPFTIILPNFEFPRSKDSGGGNLLEYAVFYEIGYAVYRDPRYLSLIHHSTLQRGTQIVAEESGLGRSRAPITIFNLVPDLPRDSSGIYPEQSVNLVGNGFAVLRNGKEEDRRTLYLDYGIMGGEHGHPDRLQIGYTARGRNWIVDPLNESYFNPNLQLWYRQTIAHNTLVVDQTSQTWANGEGKFFGTLPELQVASGLSTTVYPGARLTRTVIQSGDYFIDIFDAASPDVRTFDWPLHGSGSVTVTGPVLVPEPLDRFGHEPGVPGYDQLKDIMSGATDSAWSAVFTAADGEKLLLLAVRETGTRVFTSMTPPLGGFYKQMVTDQSPLPMVFSRRTGTETRFVHLIHAFRDVRGPLNIRRDGSRYHVTTSSGTDIIGADVERSVYSLVRLSGGSVIACAGFNTDRITIADTTLLSAPHPLDAVACRWLGRTLSLDVQGAFAQIRIRASGIDTVTVNGTPTRFSRDGGTDIVVNGPAAFLSIPVPGDSVVCAGREQTVRFRVWNPTGTPLTGGLSIETTEDWDEHVRSQRDWWGGVVNLLPLSKTSQTRVLHPSAPRIAADWLEWKARAIVTVPARGSTDIRATLRIPADIQPAAYPLVLRFGELRRPWTLTIRPPVELDVSLPVGPRNILLVAATNTSRDSQDVQVSVTPSRGWGIPGGWTRTVRIPPGAVHPVEFPCDFGGRSSGSSPYNVTVEAIAGQYRTVVTKDLPVVVAVLAAEPPSLDGSWRGWDRSASLVIDSSNQRAKLLLGNQPWGGRDDLSATVAVMVDGQFLYVGAEVADDSVVAHWNFPAMSYPWDTDCMEVVIDTRFRSDQRSDPPTPGLFRHLSMPEYRRTEFGQDLWQGGGAGGPLLPKPLLVPAAESFFNRTDRGYTMIAKYRLAHLGLNKVTPGTTLGFDVAINDNDGTTYRKNMHIWSGYTMNQSWWDMGTTGTLVIIEGGRQAGKRPAPAQSR